MREYDGKSAVEAVALKRSGRHLAYEVEKIAIIEAESVPQLRKLTALRFIEWAQKNPGGVISLPTGKSADLFIRWTTRILQQWDSAEIQTILSSYGIDGARRPDMRSLSFVQAGEFYPIDSRQHNSLHYYISEYYIKGLGLDPDRALLIDTTALGLPAGLCMAEVFPDGLVDLSLRVRQTRTDLERLQKEVINRVDMFCTEYETRIRELGGIGFYLGGIGPDGHIAFNVRGSSIYSVTRLTPTNYETQASAATDLGGIENSRNHLVITIGLATITANPSATIIIAAAGGTNFVAVRQAIEEPKHQQAPASILQDFPHARFYVNAGLGGMLTERKLEDFRRLPAVSDEAADAVTIDLSLRLQKQLLELTREDFAADPRGAELLAKSGQPHREICQGTYERIVAKIERGLKPLSQSTFLHTEPHQDDIMLGYLAYIYHLVRDPSNKHHFANITSGFTSVSGQYFLAIIRKLKEQLTHSAFTKLLREGYFNPADTSKKMEDVYLFLDGSAARSQEKKNEAEARRLMRSLIDVYQSDDLTLLNQRVGELEDYLLTQYPGAKDPPDIQTLKGSLREWEAELLWAYFGIEAGDVHALRLGFYRGDSFGQEPQVNRDVLPIFELLKTVDPQVVSVAFDPEGSGPDTHYKALQAVAEAVRMFANDAGGEALKIWGYRNVWYRFEPAEVNLMVPVSLNTLSLLHTAFMNCFGSQSAASFPSPEHDGPFSELAQKIQVEQYGMIKTCLGKDFFLKHPHPRLRAARGMIFLKEMSLAEFNAKVRALKNATEAQ
jgi:glucosamine-6-phosphate deaminase